MWPDPGLRTPGDVRHWATPLLRRLGAEDKANDCLLVLSELVTNAIEHTSGAIRVDLEPAGHGGVRISVTDSSRTPPTPRTPDERGGRGLLLIAALCRSWGTEPLPSGKRVWAEIAGQGPGQLRMG